MRTNTLILCVAGSAFVSSASAGPIVIDSFTDRFDAEAWIFSAGNTVNTIGKRAGLEVGGLALADGYQVGDAWGGFVARSRETQEHFGLGGVFGGHRYADLRASDPSNMGSSVSVYSSDGRMSFNTAFGTQGILNLVYEGSGGLNLDMTSAAGTGVVGLDLLSGDMHIDGYDQYDRPVPISIFLTSGLGTASESTFGITDHLLVEGGYNFALEDYQAGGVDLSDIDRVGVLIDQSAQGLAAVDFSIGQITIGTDVVPSPSGLAVLCLGGVAAVRRRR